MEIYVTNVHILNIYIYMFKYTLRIFALVNMEKPSEPNKDDCCNSGCNPCIFDVYEKQLQLYNTFLKKGEVSDVVTNNAISQLEYTSFKLVVNKELCPAHKIFAFKRAVHAFDKKVCWKAGDHFLLKYNSVDATCTRAYTPVNYKVGEFECDFVIIVKIYASGIVSSYLHNLVVGQETLWRGPYGSYELVPNKYDRMIMVAQGTGVAPLYSIIQNVLNNEDDFTKIVLFFCCSSQETILFRNELYAFQSYWNFSYFIFIPFSSDCFFKYKEPIQYRKLEFEDIEALEPFSIKDQFLLCGSSSFMDEFKSFFLSVDNLSIENIVIF